MIDERKIKDEFAPRIKSESDIDSEESLKGNQIAEIFLLIGTLENSLQEVRKGIERLWAFADRDRFGILK
jgi:hypothetical protein